MLADTVLFAERKEPRHDIENGENILALLHMYSRRNLQRTMGQHAVRLILAFADFSLKCHPEQCSLAEFSSYTVRDVIAHIDLAAEARVKKTTPR